MSVRRRSPSGDTGYLCHEHSIRLNGIVWVVYSLWMVSSQNVTITVKCILPPYIIIIPECTHVDTYEMELLAKVNNSLLIFTSNKMIDTYNDLMILKKIHYTCISKKKTNEIKTKMSAWPVYYFVYVFLFVCQSKSVSIT